MLQQKFTNLKRLMNDLTTQKLDPSKLDSISLISQNLTRNQYPQKMKNPYLFNPPMKSKKISLIDFQTSELQERPPTQKILSRRTKSVKQQSLNKSPRKLEISHHKFTHQFLDEAVKTRMTQVAKKLYHARNLDMEIKFSSTSWQEFLRTFLLKNIAFVELRHRKIDLSGLSLIANSMKAAIQILYSYENINLSRNMLTISHVNSLGRSKIIQELVLKNCNMKNEQLCKLFQLLLDAPIKKLSLSSPDIKDRNNLTQYEQLYKFIECSQTLECLQLSNIQIHPENQIFLYAKKSKTLKKLDLSKNTGVVGMCKNITQLNLSWNAISKPISLRCMDSSMIKLDLTGNQIRSHLFEQFLSTTNYPALQILILNKIVINEVGDWLRLFLEKTKSLVKLSLVECQLSTTVFMSIVHGLQLNRTVRHLNLSNNKFPIKGFAQDFAITLQKSNISHLYMQQCDIKDECGAVLFDCLSNNQNIEYIDVSKNNLSQKTSEKICECLKKGCYTLLVLITTQNFIKYLQMKQIVGYISRNIFISKTKVKQQYKKYKNNITNTGELFRLIERAELKINDLRSEIVILEDQLLLKQLHNDYIKGDILTEKLRLMNEEEQMYEKKKNQIMEELEHLTNQIGNKNQQNQLKLTSNQLN